MDGSELAGLAAYQNNLVSAENDDVTSGSMSPNSILFIFYPVSPFYPLEKFWPRQFKKLERER